MLGLHESTFVVARRFAIGLAAAWIAMSSVAAAAESEEEEELDEVTVTATRSGNLVRDEPIRVEVLPEEEIEENLTVQPGNLTSLLNELPGVRMQQTAPALGGTALQMRGLPGRLTLVLQDGLPLFGTQTDSFGLLQTPPLDLGQVELIKGVGSALYGGSALGGVLNLVSRQPGGGSEVLLNRNSRGGSDLVGFASAKTRSRADFTLTASINDQSREDIDHDAWADLAGFRRYMVRPRFFAEDEDRSVFATVGYVDESRTGGTMPNRTLADGSTVREGLKTRRLDGGLTIRQDLNHDLHLNSRWSAAHVDSIRLFDNERVQSSLTSGYGEGTLSGRANGHAWLLGAAVQYEKLASADAPGAEYSYSVPGLFVQDEFSPIAAVKLSASARLDVHNEYGTFFSPRVSALIRPTEEFSARISFGTGFAAPTPRLEDIESTSLARLDALSGLQAERASSTSVDIQWRDDDLEVNASVFSSTIRRPLAVRQSPMAADKLELINNMGPYRVIGSELLFHLVAGPLHFIGSTTYLDATESASPGGRRKADRTARWSGELAALFEDEKLGRIGIELGYTGRQALYENPYSSASKPFLELGVLAEARLGRVAIFFNAENLTNIRQSRYDSLLRQTPLPTGERTIDLWSPIAGRIFNIGVRAKL
jgi:iron complex outermembrane receptor protein